MNPDPLNTKPAPLLTISAGPRAITPKIAIDSLAGKICPACGEGKKPRKSLCHNCYYALSPETRDALWQKVTKGYEPALHAALTELGALVFQTESIF